MREKKLCRRDRKEGSRELFVCLSVSVCDLSADTQRRREREEREEREERTGHLQS